VKQEKQTACVTTTLKKSQHVLKGLKRTYKSYKPVSFPSSGGMSPVSSLSFSSLHLDICQQNRKQDKLKCSM
jgi:hypothetical protein